MEQTREDYGQIGGQKRVRAQEKGPRWGEEDLFVFPLGLDVLMMLAMRPRMTAMIL